MLRLSAGDDKANYRREPDNKTAAVQIKPNRRQAGQAERRRN